MSRVKIRELTIAERMEYNMLTKNSCQFTIGDYLGCQPLTTEGKSMFKQINVRFDDEIYEMLDYLQNIYYQKNQRKIVYSKIIKQLIINYSDEPVDLENIIHSAIQSALGEGGCK